MPHCNSDSITHKSQEDFQIYWASSSNFEKVPTMVLVFVLVSWWKVKPFFPVYPMLLLVCRGNIEQYFLSPGTMLYCNIVLLEDICLVRLLWQSLISVLTHCCQAQVHVCLMFKVFRIRYIQEAQVFVCSKYFGFGTFKKGVPIYV